MLDIAVDELATKYRVPVSRAAGIAEVAISKAFSAALNTNVICTVQDHKIKLITFSGKATPAVMDPSRIRKKLKRQVLYLLEAEFQKHGAITEFRTIRDLQGQVINATISRIADNHTLYAVLDIEDVFQKVLIIGECPLRHQPPHERGVYRLQETKKFYITSVRPVTGRRGEGRVRVMLSRVTRGLPAALLAEITGIGEIRCTRRIAGAFSDIETPAYLPKSAIKTVGKELHEHLNVIIRSSEK